MRSDNPLGFNSFENDREIIFKVLRDTRTELNELKKLVYDLVSSSGASLKSIPADQLQLINRNFKSENESSAHNAVTIHNSALPSVNQSTQVIEVEETLSLQEKEIDMIKKALRKYKGKRKNAAKELGISERTLYRKINEYAIEE